MEIALPELVECTSNVTTDSACLEFANCSGEAADFCEGDATAIKKSC